MARAKQESEIKPSIPDALAARGKSFPARNQRSRPRFDETMLGGDVGGLFALRWRCCRFRLANWKGLANSIRGGVLLFPPSLPFFNVLAQGRARFAPSRGTPQLGETYREAGGREARSAIGSRCMQTVGRFATWRLRTMAWWVGGRWCTSFDRTHVRSAEDPCSRGIRLMGSARQPCVVTRRRRTLSCELCAQEAPNHRCSWMGCSGGRK